MIKILKTAAPASLSTSSYTTPTATLVEVRTEGVLCVSGQLEGWEEGELDW